MFELSDSELQWSAEAIENAHDDSGVWLDYEQRAILVTPAEHCDWPLDHPERYCFMGFAGELRIKLAK